MLRSFSLTFTVLAIFALSASADNRSFDGSGNNLSHPSWGQRRTNFVRIDPVSRYDDGIAAPSTLNRPNPRDISNAIGNQTEPMFDERGLSDFVWQWGQFVDHDIALTPTALDAMYINVTSPADPVFPFIPMFRSDYDFATGTSASNPRQHYNANTAYLDGSMIYASEEERADGLRTFSDGKLKTSGDNLLPRNTSRFENDNPGDEPHPTMFLTGDVRANEQHGLIAMHTIFMREHNRLATQVAIDNPSFDDEQIYHHTRKLVGGLIQHITYNEYLPALTGTASLLNSANDYDSSISSVISNEFATAIFRLGHTQVSPTLLRLNNEGSEAAGGPRALDDAFFTPSMIDSQEIDYLAKGLASRAQQATDLQMIDELRNQLFGLLNVQSGGLDLLAINIHRGRDHGIATLTEIQEAAGLPVATSFADVTSDTDLQADLELLYPSVDEIDLWIGLLAEDKLPNSALGHTMQTLLLDQFSRLMLGDRFFYQWDDDLTESDLEFIKSTRLSDVILANTGLTNLQNNVFFVPEPSSGMLVLLALFAFANRRNRQ